MGLYSYCLCFSSSPHDGLFVFVWDLFVIVILFFLITVMRVMGLMSDGLYIQVSYIFSSCVSVKNAWSFHRLFFAIHCEMDAYLTLSGMQNE